MVLGLKKGINPFYFKGLIVWAAVFVIAGTCSDAWKVVSVTDGDTIVVKRGLDRERVRLKGVDAPEIPNRKYNRKGDYFGWESRECLMEMLSGHTVRLVYDTPFGQPERDKYDRLLAYVYVGESLINARMIEQGCARTFLKYPHSRMEQFIRLEAQAREQRLGLWARK